jgi:hypothetical protein
MTQQNCPSTCFFVRLSFKRMAKPGISSAIEDNQVLDQSDVDEDLWGSQSQSGQISPQRNAQSRNKETSYKKHEKHDAREEALRRELQSVRKVNEAIEGAIESLAKARNSMKVRPKYRRIYGHCCLTVEDLAHYISDQFPDSQCHGIFSIISSFDLDQDTLANGA